MSEKKEFKPLDVGASERVPWKIAEGLAKNIGFKEDGSIEVGKNLEVDGGLQVNEGANFFQGNIKILEVLTHDSDGTTSPAGYIIGCIDYISEDKTFVDFSGGIYLPGDGTMYNIGATEINITYIDDYKIVTDAEDIEINWTRYPVVTGNLKTLFGGQHIVGKGNIDLYRHVIRVNGSQTTDTSFNTATAVFEYISSNALICDSVQDLRTLVKAGTANQTINANYYKSSQGNPGDSLAGFILISSSLCQIVTNAGNYKKVVDITQVSDTVTTI